MVSSLHRDIKLLSRKLDRLSPNQLSRLRNLSMFLDKSDFLSDTYIQCLPRIFHDKIFKYINTFQIQLFRLTNLFHNLMVTTLPGIFLIFSMLCLFVLSSLLIQSPIERTTLTKLLFSNISESIPLHEEKCLIEFPQEFTEIVRTPVKNCDFCRNVHEITRVSNISAEDFEQLYATIGIPLIVTDVTKHWKAMGAFSFNFLKGIYKNDSLLFKDEIYGDCQFFPWKADFSSLKDVFNMSSQQALGLGKPWYVGWSNCDPKVADVLRDYYVPPYFLSKESHAGRIDWLFMGSPGFGAPMHIDYVDNPSWQTMVVGDKLWTLVPPSECYLECGPKFTALVKKGETIVINTNIWYHSTQIIGDQMSIAIGSEFD